MTIPAHWSEVDPGPLTAASRDARVKQILTEMAVEQSAADRFALSAPKAPSRWRTALSREYRRQLDFLTSRLTAEQTRPTQENP